MLSRRSRWSRHPLTRLGCLALGLLLAVPLQAAPPSPDVQELVIRATYARLQSYAAGSGKEVSFLVDGFHTYLPAELGGVRLVDAVTMPSGSVLDVVRNIRQNDYTGQAGVFYAPSWSEHEASWAASREGRVMARASLADALRALAEKQPELHAVEAVTTFTVTAELDGRSRTYSAAFIWLPATVASQYTFIVADNITQGVEEAAREVLPAVGSADYLKGLEPEVPVPDPDATCSAWSNSTQQSYHAYGSAGHLTGGYHHGYATFKVTCSCTSTCASTCVASIPSSRCYDDGGLMSDACHKMASSLNANTHRQDNGNITGAGCGAGAGCVQKACLFCLCGLSVTVSVSGVNVSFATSGSPSWQGNLRYSRTCAKCT